MICAIPRRIFVEVSGYFGCPQPAFDTGFPPGTFCHVVQCPVNMVDFCRQLFTGDVLNCHRQQEPAIGRTVTGDFDRICTGDNGPHLCAQFERAPPLAHWAQPTAAKTAVMQFLTPVWQHLKFREGCAVGYSAGTVKEPRRLFWVFIGQYFIDRR